MSEYPQSPLFAFPRLSAVVLALFFVSAPAAHSQTDTSSWVGRKVYLKPNAKKMDGAKIVTTSEMEWDEVVLKEQGPWVYLRDAWVAKSDVMNLNEAFDYWVDEVRRNPQSATAWVFRGKCWRERGEHANALKDFDEAIRLNPKDDGAYNNRGGTKLDTKDYSGAMNDYTESIRLNPKNALSYNGRGVARDISEDYEGAMKDYNEAILLNPSFAHAYLNRGITKRTLKDPGPAHTKL
jgi:tetratricopeptide (TPR) repeat protein